MTREKLEKSSHDMTLGIRDYVEDKLVNARKQGFIKIEDDVEFQKLLSFTTSAVTAGYEKCKSTFLRSLDESD